MPDLPIYLDYQATTPVDPRVREAMAPYWCKFFGNPHSRGHRFGWDARDAVELARAQVADLIGADEDEIIFVSGATESCNFALRGIATTAADRRHIVTLTTEHPAVLETVRRLGGHGFDIDVLPVMPSGRIDLSTLRTAISHRTLLVSVMLANNEIGVIQPLPEISALCQSAGAMFHTDATQAVGRIEVDVDKLGVDLLSFSGHKMYGPNGVGVLYVRARSGLRMEPLLTGGTQEHGMRAGTVATPLVVGLGRACEIAGREWTSDSERLNDLTRRLQTELQENLPGLQVFGDLEHRVPGNLSVGLPGVSAEDLVNAIAGRVAISTGSACSTGSPTPSRVLLALGVGHEFAATGVRISLGRFTTAEQIHTASAVMRKAYSNMATGAPKR